MENEQQVQYKPENSQLDNKKPNKKLVKALIIIIVLLLAVTGYFGYLLLNNSDETSNNGSENTNQSDSEVEDIANNEDSTLNFDGSLKPEIPEDYSFYEGDGFSFYYPESWGKVTTDVDNAEPVFTGSFALRDDIILYLNSGNQDLSGGGRGGALWDCIGYTFIGGKEYACVAAYIDEDGKRISGSAIEDFNLVSTRDALDFVVVRDYVYFEENVSEILFNPSSSKYYGGTLLVKEPTDSDRDELETIAKLFSTDILEGL